MAHRPGRRRRRRRPPPRSTSASGYGTLDAASTVASVLVPQYLQSVPEKDGWKNDYEYYLNTANVLAKTVMAIRAGGRDGYVSGTQYTVVGFDPTDYDQDIVWADGFFVRWPQKTN